MLNIALIFTGTELLKGSAVNTNLAALGSALTAAGVPPSLEICAGDTSQALCRALSAAMASCEAVVVGGGLGPTEDDITLEWVCRFFGKECAIDAGLKLKVEEFWAQRHRGHCPKMQYKQAMLPEGGEILPNPEGSASGYYFIADYAGKTRHVFLMPGPPREFEPMAVNYVVPKLVSVAGAKLLTTCGFLAAGVGEAMLCKTIAPVLAKYEVEFACTAKNDGTDLYLTSPDWAVARAAIEEARQLVGAVALPAGYDRVAPYVLEVLKQRNLTLGTAESCTGGGVATTLTDVPGASEVFRGAVVAYANAVKSAVLKVPEAMISAHGAVSSEVAIAMAAGACEVMKCDCSIAVTGIAGPGGGSESKPVGTVFIAVNVCGKITCNEFNFRGSRRAIRERSIGSGLVMLYKALMNLC